MFDIKELKKNSTNSLNRLAKVMESMTTNQIVDDSAEYWKGECDKSGNGFFIIRFLPPPPMDGEDALPFVKYYDHGFKGPTGTWYIEKSLTSIGKPDPLYELNSKLWEAGQEEQVRKQRRRCHYVTNIYVIKDSKRPENEGKIFKFEFGKKIMEKIMGAMNPTFEDDVAFDPFNLWTGANFKLKIRKVDGYVNYDLSEFDTVGPLFEDDEKNQEIWNGEYSLKAILDPKNFKSYDELQKRLNKALGIGQVDSNSVMESKPKIKVPEPTQNNVSNPQEMKIPSSEEEEDDLKYFSSLLNDD